MTDPYLAQTDSSPFHAPRQLAQKLDFQPIWKSHYACESQIIYLISGEERARHFLIILRRYPWTCQSRGATAGPQQFCRDASSRRTADIPPIDFPRHIKASQFVTTIKDEYYPQSGSLYMAYT